MAKGLLLGALGVLAACALAGYAVVSAGAIPAAADEAPPASVKGLLRRSLDRALLRGAPKGPNPAALTDANLLAGVRLYAAHCAFCHGAADAAPSRAARGLYFKAPQLAKYGVEDDEEGETYWKIAHGLRMTGMPAFRGTLTEEQLWQVTLFLKNMDSLPPAPLKAWKAVPSAARS